MKDVHEFDNKLQEQVKKLEEKINAVSSVSKDEKKSSFLELKEHIEDKIAQHILNIIINDLERFDREKGPNYDPINKLHADDLLFIIVQELKKEKWDKDLLEPVTQQIKDMVTGLCAQGRTIRLLQIVKALP